MVGLLQLQLIVFLSKNISRVLDEDWYTQGFTFIFTLCKKFRFYTQEVSSKLGYPHYGKTC